MQTTAQNLTGLLLVFLSIAATSQEKESTWEPYIRYFEQLDVEEMPPKNAVLFVGSSSIVFWRSLQEDMSPLAVINRGFGGSQMHELNQFRDRIVTCSLARALNKYSKATMTS